MFLLLLKIMRKPAVKIAFNRKRAKKSQKVSSTAEFFGNSVNVPAAAEFNFDFAKLLRTSNFFILAT
jgi:hypothetical protein